jgi:AcrR family transcriptional regulator
MLTGHARRLKGLRMISAMPPQPAPSPPRQRAALLNARSRETRRALVRAALRLWGQGDFDVAYEASTVADIARAAGVSRGTFYFHFAGKEDILLEMSSATVQAMIDQIQAGMRRGIALHPLTPNGVDGPEGGPRPQGRRAAGRRPGLPGPGR